MAGLAEYLPDMLAEFGPVTLRRMFGGHGVYHAGLMFGIVMDDTLYLKTDSRSQRDFAALGLAPFTYRDRHGRTTRLSYWRAPDEVLEDPATAAQWARRAYASAAAARDGKRSKRAAKAERAD